MKDSDKEFLAAFVSACVVSMVFYLHGINCVYSRLDLYIVELGVALPFILPFFILFKNKTRRDC